ncbi:MAG: hypothetical protein ORN85_08950 [Sediminibacterium sp.]|nr:hypothetical protein [Sediminibacterium sp.]
MQNYRADFYPFVPVGHLKVWILVPDVLSKDENINYYYDFKESYKEFEEVFKLLQFPWVWLPLTIDNYKTQIVKIKREREDGLFFPIALNLCDGDDINGAPGINVIKYLENLNVLYTGSNQFFYKITTSKIDMKKAFDEQKISTPSWYVLDKIFLSQSSKNLEFPLIVKPAISAGSLGISVKNVVHNLKELQSVYKYLASDPINDWHLNEGGIFAEKFIIGREFTCFLIGDSNNKKNRLIYEPVERVFHSSLNDFEKFLSYERLWEIYENETAMPNDEVFFNYQLPPQHLIEQIKELSWQAFCAVKGVGYARIDIRFDELTNKMYVLEINAQCGISEDENFTSIGAILKFSNKSYAEMLKDIINEAFLRNSENFEL